ncbi:MAG: hypothetical protein WBM90_01955 [Acidimicrobiia bacterium]
MRRVAPLLVFVIVACSPGDAGEVTTTVQGPTTSTLGATTTTQVVTTTMATETTIPTSTTSTLAPSTTTLPAGNWAEEPLIVAGFGALGWWDGANWLYAEEVGALPVVGGEDYQIAVIGLEATTTGGPQTVVCDPLENLGVQLANEQVLGEFPGPYGVAISAPWDLQPHLVEPFVDSGTYASIASTLLSQRGINVPDPVIKQAFRIDLEGDGTNEILVVTEDLVSGYEAAAGSYSLVFLRKVVDGEVQTAVLGDSIITDPLTQLVIGFTVGAIADLNGTGQMEIVIDSAYYEGLGVEVWEYVNDDLGPVSVLSTGCGS